MAYPESNQKETLKKKKDFTNLREREHEWGEQQAEGGGKQTP